MSITLRAAAVLLVVAGSAAAQIEPLTNDSCATPIPVVAGTNPAPAQTGHFFTNAGATDSAGFSASCQSNVHADVFFSFTAQVSGPHEFRTDAPTGFAAGTLTDTVLQVFAGCAGSAELGCDDDSGAGLLSRITGLVLNAGTNCVIRVASYGTGLSGTFYLRVIPPAGTPANDLCAGAFLLVDGTFAGNNAAAVSDAPALPPSSCPLGDHHVWYSYANPGPCGRTVTVATCGALTNFDTVLAAWSGTCGTLVPIACNDDSCGTRSSVSFIVPAGQSRLLSVASYFATGGTFALDVSSTIAQAEPIGAACGTIAPLLDATLPRFGSIGTLSISGAEPNTAGLLGLSALGIPSPLPGGCLLQLDLATATILTPLTVDATGAWSLAAPIPNDPLLACVEVVVQGAVSGASGLALTNGVRLVLGP